MKVINDKKRLLFTLKEKISGTLVVAPEGLVLVEESLQETPTPVDSRPYKVYTALLSQSGTNAPVATVLENTLGGDIVWSREDSGIYIGTLNEGFVLGKTFLSGKYRINSVDDPSSYSISDSGVDTVYVTSESSEVLQDDLLYNAPIEIRVYN